MTKKGKVCILAFTNTIHNKQQMLTIDHIGYAVSDINKAIDAMSVLGYNFEEVIKDTSRNITICFGYLENYRIELVASTPPLQSVKETPVNNILNKIGPTPYHICYRSNEIESDIRCLIKRGYKITIPPAPAIAFKGKNVVFMYSLPVGLIEIVEE